jgi:hypothetical protein
MPAAAQTCVSTPNTENPYQPPAPETKAEKVKIVELGNNEPTTEQPRTLFSIGSFALTTKHVPLVIGGVLLYAILLAFIVWYNRQAHKEHKGTHKLNFKPTRKK